MSGAGKVAIDELYEQTQAGVEGKDLEAKVLPVKSAENIIQLLTTQSHRLTFFKKMDSHMKK